MDFMNNLIEKIGMLAPEWDPSLILQELTAPQNVPSPAQAAPSWNWMDPTGTLGPQVPIPGDPRMVQQGPLAGVPQQLPQPPRQAAPLSPEQLVALQRQMPQSRPFPQAPAVSPFRSTPNIQLQPVQLPNTQSPQKKRRGTFSELFGR